MKPFILFIAAAAIFLAVGVAYAADEAAERENVKSELLLPECSWSKMNKQEYDACQKKRRTLKVMTPSERAKYLDHTEPDMIIVDDNGGRRTGARVPVARPRR